jgi:hypothetical protein
MYCLYQSILVIDRPLLSNWAISTVRTSRDAIWKCVRAIVQTFKQAHEDKLVLFLPLNMLLVAFVPLTIYNMHMRNVLTFDPDTIGTLAICSQVVKVMIDLHAGADFYNTILSSTLTLADRYKKHSASGVAEGRESSTDHKSEEYLGDPEAEMILPSPQLHSLILRFHNLALALGRMPDVESFISGAQP